MKFFLMSAATILVASISALPSSQPESVHYDIEGNIAERNPNDSDAEFLSKRYLTVTCFKNYDGRINQAGFTSCASQVEGLLHLPTKMHGTDYKYDYCWEGTSISLHNYGSAAFTLTQSNYENCINGLKSCANKHWNGGCYLNGANAPDPQLTYNGC